MKSLFNQDAYSEIINRISILNLKTPAVWGTMSVDKMLAHCSIPLEAALGKRQLKKDGNFLIRLLFKASLYNDTPYRKNLPTSKNFLNPESLGFDEEKKRLLQLISEVHEKSEKHNWPDHPSFGKFTSEQWGKSFYKHLDHHLRQFNV